jgi:hypothetical protein
MALQITSSSWTKFDHVVNSIRETGARTNSGGAVQKAMYAILDDACVNTNHTFEDDGRTEVSLAEWDKVFTLNVEFLMANSDNATAVGNLKHFGFRP